LDREGREPTELLDEVEDVLKIRCAPVTWPIGMGKRLKGIYHLLDDRIYVYQEATGEKNGRLGETRVIEGLASNEAAEFLGNDFNDYRDEIELVRGASNEFDIEAYLKGELTPVFFGSAISNFGVRELLDAFVDNAPGPRERDTTVRKVQPTEE